MKAIDTYKDVIGRDPYRLDNLDTYSNLLYVHEMKSELADLAHKAVSIEKYRVETCCIIGMRRRAHRITITFYLPFSYLTLQFNLTKFNVRFITRIHCF